MRYTRTLLIVYLLAIVVCCLFVPWEATYQGMYLARGYAPIWSPPAASFVDTGRLAIEIVGLSAVAGLVWVIFRKR